MTERIFLPSGERDRRAEERKREEDRRRAASYAHLIHDLQMGAMDAAGIAYSNGAEPDDDDDDDDDDFSQGDPRQWPEIWAMMERRDVGER